MQRILLGLNYLTTLWATNGMFRKLKYVALAGARSFIFVLRSVLEVLCTLAVARVFSKA